MTNKEASILFNALTVAQAKYESQKRLPVDPMPGKMAFEQGYSAGFQEALKVIAIPLRQALSSLVEDAHQSNEDGFWRIGPFDDTPDSRLGYARQVLAD